MKLNEITNTGYNAFITNDYNEWCSLNPHKKVNIIRNGEPQEFNEEGALYLQEKCKFETFMLEPVGVYKGNCILAKSVMINDLNEFVDFCNNSKEEILLYGVLQSGGNKWVVSYGVGEIINET